MNNFEQQVEGLIRDTSFIMYCQKKDDREIAVWEVRLLTQPELVPVVEEAKTRVRMMARGVIDAEMELGLARLKNSVALLNGEQAAIIESGLPPAEKKWWISAAGIVLLVFVVFAGIWHRDKLSGTNVPANDTETLEQAAIKMEKKYKVKVVFEKPSLREYNYTGIFENEELPKALENMKRAVPELKYRIEKNQVILY